MTRREGKRQFADYCRNLERLRYFDGHVAGYTSRLHYLSFWMTDHLRRKTIEEVVLPTNLTQPLHIDLHYMSRHAESYPMLRNHPGARARNCPLGAQILGQRRPLHPEKERRSLPQ